MIEHEQPFKPPPSLLMKRLTKKLAYDYSDRFLAEQVIATFDDSYVLLAKAARITAFLPTLAERSPGSGSTTTRKPTACKPSECRRFSSSVCTTPAGRRRLPRSPATTARTIAHSHRWVR